MRDPVVFIIWMFAHQPACDLLRRPFAGQLGRYRATEIDVARQLAGLGPMRGYQAASSAELRDTVLHSSQNVIGNTECFQRVFVVQFMKLIMRAIRSLFVDKYQLLSSKLKETTVRRR